MKLLLLAFGSRGDVQPLLPLCAGLRDAGVPTTIVSHMADQPYWGRRVYELGVGHKPIPRHELTTERLAEAIKVMVSSPTMQANAAKLGEQIRQETGVANAVRAVAVILHRQQAHATI